MTNISDINIADLHMIPGSHLHFIGIGGSSMSGLAELALHRGYKISGSDSAASDATDHLSALGAKICIGHCRDNITQDCTLVIYTLAISADNPEYLRAHELGIPTIERGTFLGAIAREYNHVTAVAGTHGKTSTTSMLSSILIAAKKDPNIHLGGISSAFNSNVRTGHSDVFVTEACEYHENFLNILPEVGIVLNVEAEHLDYFGSMEKVIASFNKFIGGISADGLLVVCADSDPALACAATSHCNMVTYSIETPVAPSGLINASQKRPIHHYYAGNIIAPVHGEHNTLKTITDGYSFTLFIDEAPVCDIKLSVPGKHNIENALAAIATSYYLNCSLESIQQGLAVFKGAGRRFDPAGEYNGAFIINDYAHHPTEIKATIEAARSICEGKIWSVFQPHTYSRAIQFKDDFCEALKASDHVIITDIFAAREPFTDAIHSKSMNDLFVVNGIDSVYISSFDDIAEYLKARITAEDMVLLLGAGTINKLAEKIK